MPGSTPEYICHTQSTAAGNNLALVAENIAALVRMFGSTSGHDQRMPIIEQQHSTAERRGTPYGLAMAPVIKVATRSELAKRWPDLIDVDAGRIASGQATIQDIGWELFQLTLDIAGGEKQACADKLGLHNDLTLFNPAPIT